MKTAFIIIAVIVALTAFGIYDRYRRNRELRRRLAEEFAGPSKHSMSQKRYAALHEYRDSLFTRTYDIDDITWNDLEMDRVYAELNRTQSAVGEEYLYAALFRPEFCEMELDRRERLISLFSENASVRMDTQVALSRLGKMRNVSLYKYLTSFEGVKSDGYLRHLIPVLGYAAAAVLGVLGYGAPCIAVAILSVGYSIVSYYRRKSEIEPYLKAMIFVSNWIGAIERLAKLPSAKDTPLADELDVMREVASEFSAFRRGTSIIADTDPTGDPMQMLMDYVRMLTHVDLMKFNRMYAILREKKSDLERLFEDTGRIDMALAVASFRASRKDWSLPKLSTDPVALSFTNLCHPMIEKPVPNSLTVNGCVLLTGSNASGKSTFLKTVAINALLAQTTHTVIGESYEGQYYRIFSSMALRDDLASKESYYIVEIRSLKRILDAAEEGEPVLCFVDEVLRGTNTAERIAASGQILKYLAKLGTVCFAATHDLELTETLKDCYDMRHFSETVTEEAVTFDYILKEGKATSRNAILLLRLFGYPQEIVEAADREAVAFVEERMNQG